MFLIRRDRLDLIGADLDVKSMLGTVGLKSSVDYTIVNGKIVDEWVVYDHLALLAQIKVGQMEDA